MRKLYHQGYVLVNLGLVNKNLMDEEVLGDLEQYSESIEVYTQAKKVKIEQVKAYSGNYSKKAPSAEMKMWNFKRLRYRKPIFA